MARLRLRIAIFRQFGVVPLLRRDPLEVPVFDDGNKLDVGGVEFLPQEPIHIQEPPAIEVMNTGQPVQRHSITLDLSYTPFCRQSDHLYIPALPSDPTAQMISLISFLSRSFAARAIRQT